MNATNATHCRPQELHPALPALLGVLSLGGLVFNSISLGIFCFVFKRWNSAILLQFNLALVDTIVLPITPLTVAYFSLGHHWLLGGFLCRLQVFMLSTHLYGSIYFLMLISIHRYQAIVHYNARSLWRQKSFLKKLVLAVWALLVLQGLPSFFVLKTSVIDNSVSCLNVHQSKLSDRLLIYSIVLGLFCFLLPFGISMTSYVMLGTYISRISQANLRGRLIKTKSIQMITAALVIFAVCFAPLHVCLTAGMIVKYYEVSCELLHHIEVAYYTSLVFTVMNCCLDPFIYNFANEKFNRSFSKLLRRFRYSK